MRSRSRHSASALALALAGLASSALAGDLAPSVELLGGALPVGGSLGLEAVDGGLIGGAASYEARFDAAGVTFVAVLGAEAPFDHTLSFEAVSVERGGAAVFLEPVAPRAEGLTAVYARGHGVSERYVVTAAGLEQSFLIEEPIGGSGELVVRGRLGGAVAGMAERQGDGSQRFAGEHGGVSFGALTGIDADGRAVAGEVRVMDGVLELVLPAAFVDGAAWPLLLDPLIGSVFTVDGSTNNDTQADVSFEELSQRYLAVWLRTFSAASAVVRGQRLDVGGAPVGGTLFFSALGVAGRPRVATVNGAGRFLVVWVQTDPGIISTVFAMPCNPATGTLYEPKYLDSGAPGTLHHVDVGGEMLNSGFPWAMVVWDDDTVGIVGSRMEYQTSGLFTSTVFTVASDFFGVTHAMPSISRSPGYAGLYGVAYTRRTLVADADPYAAAVNRHGTVLGSAKLFDTPDEEVEVDVDGGGVGVGSGNWVVASGTALSGLDVLRATPVRWTGSAVVVDPPVVISSNLPYADSFSVSQRPGKAFIAWQERSFLIDALNVRGVDPATCMTCEGSLFVNVVDSSKPAYPTVSLSASSSGAYYNTLGLVLWNRLMPVVVTVQSDIMAQSLGAIGTSGTYTNLGGGCGQSGFLDLSQAGEPAVGNGYFVPGITGADPLASAAILNITVPQAPLTCGACSFAPYLLTFLTPVIGGAASQVVPIPCNPAYVGVSLDIQYSVASPSSSPCSLYPHFAYSNIVRITLGT